MYSTACHQIFVPPPLLLSPYDPFQPLHSFSGLYSHEYRQTSTQHPPAMAEPKAKLPSDRETQVSRRVPLIGFLPRSAKNHFIAMMAEFAGTFMFLLFALGGTNVVNAAPKKPNLRIWPPTQQRFSTSRCALGCRSQSMRGCSLESAVGCSIQL